MDSMFLHQYYISLTKIFFMIFALLKANEDVSKNLAAIKTMLYGTESQEPLTDQVAQLAHEMYDNNMLFLLVQNLAKIDFEVCSL